MIVNYPRMRRRAAWPDDLDTALEFVSANPFSISAPKNWDGKIEYTNGSGWKTWDGSEITSGENGSNHCVYLRGTGNSKITGTNSASNKWNITGTNVDCNGDIDLLLDYSTVKSGDHPSMASYCYAYMFYGCTSLTAAPSLPATTLEKECYVATFYGCTSLTAAPSLPATTLANSCYSFMFYGCTSLTSVPALPATTLTNFCYNFMFYGCKKLKLSSTASGTYTKLYRIPKSGTGTIVSTTSIGSNMFDETGGTFTDTPEINTTYYLDESNTIV